ncbi:MAG: hypothetical protein O3C21_00510 [Verrucomicrobia bacterium]|nr:hypothetical protein [Verrucomicrobiota bacterium]
MVAVPAIDCQENHGSHDRIGGRHEQPNFLCLEHFRPSVSRVDRSQFAGAMQPRTLQGFTARAWALTVDHLAREAQQHINNLLKAVVRI